MAIFVMGFTARGSVARALGKGFRLEERDEKLADIERFGPVRFRRIVHRAGVSHRILTPERVAKHLTAEAVLHLWALRQRSRQLDGVGYLLIRRLRADDRPRRIDVVAVLFRAIYPEPVVALERVPERIDLSMAPGARPRRDVFLHAIASRREARIGDGWQLRHVRRRRRDRDAH